MVHPSLLVDAWYLARDSDGDNVREGLHILIARMRRKYHMMPCPRKGYTKISPVISNKFKSQVMLVS